MMLGQTKIKFTYIVGEYPCSTWNPWPQQVCVIHRLYIYIYIYIYVCVCNLCLCHRTRRWFRSRLCCCGFTYKNGG